jgi:hypothetical protein
MAANGGSSLNDPINRNGFTIGNRCRLIWKNSETSYFESIKGGELPMRMSFGRMGY